MWDDTNVFDIQKQDSHPTKYGVCQYFDRDNCTKCVDVIVFWFNNIHKSETKKQFTLKLVGNV